MAADRILPDAEERTEPAALTGMLERREFAALREAFSLMNEVDVAQFIETLRPEQALVAFRTLPNDVESKVFAEFDPDTQQRIIASITDREVAAIVDDLWVDDAVDMLEEMPAPLVKRVLANASPESRRLINQYLRYPEYSAGSIMTAEFTDLRADMNALDAINRIRAIGQNKETIYTCYVIDAPGRLQGVVSVKDLLLAHDTDLVWDIMSDDVISVATVSDQEDAVKLMAKYDLISLPVVDAQKHLVGIITVDDAMDVLREETTEDFEKMAAMSPSERPYLKTSVFTLARNRFPWLLVLMVSGMLTGSILGYYEPVYAALPLLVSFIPMLTGTGGNAGSQSSTMVIRGLALGEIKSSNLRDVVWQEGRVSLVVGAVLATVNYARLVIAYPDSGLIPLVVSLAQFGAVVLANLIGGVLPIAANALRIDPAIMAAPLITSIVDALTLVLYFTVAALMLF